MDVNGSVKFGIDPRPSATAAGKHQGVKFTSRKNRQTHLPVVWNVGNGLNEVPHSIPLAGNEKGTLIQRNTHLHFRAIGGRWPMDRFVRRENVRHFRELLKTVTDEAERQRILKLLAEEQQKQKDAGDEIEEQPP